MVDPLSFITSVIAITSLAENVVTKGYHYLKAVKDCPSEVRTLMAELNVLCGILGRLKVLLEGDKSSLSATVESEDGGGLAFSEDHDKNDESLHPPDFIFACQRTLSEIEDILKKFEHTSLDSTRTDVKISRFNVSSLRRMDAKDLRWPLRKSRTIELVGALERHKSTCTLALAENSLVAVHTVLEQTKSSNKSLAMLKEKQEKLLELSITHKQEVALNWLSSVNPASKLQGFRRERQPGTGIWLFDLPEMSGWLENPNSALWIYGIPGAGKTIFSTLVVDEVLTRKRSSSIGTAYFYVRHDDRDSQVPSNVLGSIISQLARQNSTALDDVVELQTQHFREGLLAATLEVDDLVQQLFNISKYFIDTFIVIDGLDECRSTFDPDRKQLIDVTAKIHRDEKCQIHILIFSRDEFDIRESLTASDFEMVSIAAKSADLRLYVNAWLPSLEIQSETLKIEVIDTLVDEAKGMFMWVRAQVDYLQRLPNDVEKRKALKTLPPDLPKTYVRIFEVIDSTYPVQTTKFVQRLLKWLVLQNNTRPHAYIHLVRLFLKPDFLRQAICIENENNKISDAEIPTAQQILGWLGCLVRSSKSMGAINLSHFTIKEFLKMDPEKVSSRIARKYLVKPADQNYVLEVYLNYLMHDDFKSVKCTKLNEVNSFLNRHPLYNYAMLGLRDSIWAVDEIGLNDEIVLMMQRFLSMPVCESFQLWDTCMKGLRHLKLMNCLTNPVGNVILPLHFAAMTGLADEVQRLLKSGSDPNCSSLSMEEDGFFLTPLHLAICSANHGDFDVDSGTLGLTIRRLDFDNDNDSDETFRSMRILQIVRMLLNSGANVDQQLTVYCLDLSVGYEHFKARVTPLVLAVTRARWRLASILLDAGANWEAIPNMNSSLIDLCSIEGLLNKIPDREILVQRIVEFGGHQGLKIALERWRNARSFNNQSVIYCASNNANTQKLFVDAYQNGKWPEVRELLNGENGIEINCNDEKGLNALYYASVGNNGDLLYILERGAKPNLLVTTGHSALCRTVVKDCLENMHLLLKFSANIEHRDPDGWTSLLNAIRYGRYEMVKLLLDKGANADAVLDRGAGGIQIAIEQKDTKMFSLLLERRFNTISSDNYGSTPLHLACEGGLHFEVEKLIGTMTPDLNGRIDDDSLIWGTPLYVAACKRFVNIVQRLLDAGAEIDKIGPGNLLGSALMVTCAEGHCEVVNLLLSRGASLEVEGSRFLSAAGTARAFRKEKIIKVLEEHAGAIKI